MAQMTPAQMVSQFRLWKVDLNLYTGWETRGYGPGSISDPQGIIVHHTGSDAQSDSYLHFLAIDGRPPDVPAPLCNWSTDMDGDLWLIAAEKANHAGMGSSATLAKIKGGSTGYDWRDVEIRPGPDDINGNTKYYGNEVRFDGGQPMTAAQWKTVILSCAAVCDFHNWGAWRVIGHREHTSRKPDPGHTLMYMIRRDVAAALAAGPGNWPVQEEDVMATLAEVSTAMLNVLTSYNQRLYGTGGTEGVWHAQEVAARDALAGQISGLSNQLAGLDAKLNSVVAAVNEQGAANVAAINDLKTTLEAVLAPKV